MTSQRGAAAGALERELGRRLAGAPFESTMAFTAAMAWAFLRAERGRNPKVRTYWDAFHYVSTSLSVGYSNIFPVTERGKLLGALVMMVGPALSAGALDRVREPGAGAAAASTDPAVLAKLDAILEELRTIRRLGESEPPRGATPGAKR